MSRRAVFRRRGLRERLMLDAIQAGNVPHRLQERMNSPLQRRKVRLRGLGGLTACGVPGTCASATGGETPANRAVRA
jgi:hypothetical protein